MHLIKFNQQINPLVFTFLWTKESKVSAGLVCQILQVFIIQCIQKKRQKFPTFKKLEQVDVLLLGN